MNITPREARNAFYQAAANIEKRPELYDFYTTSVGEGDCPACMWGHVGRVLGFPKMSCVYDDVPVSMGLGHDDLTLQFPLRDIVNYIGSSYQAECAARLMRDFADEKWPAESTEPVRPDLQECGMSFTEMLRHVNEVKA